MKFGSLFSGIGGFDLGLERAGMECAWQVENAEFPRKVLEKHWPNVPKFGDIRNVGKEELEAADLICGGFPCQPFSVAGKRKGAADDRHLWPEMLRVISELKPTWVIGENVPGIIPIFLDQALSDLEAEGYTTESYVFPACAFGAPHQRNRLFILGYSPSKYSHEWYAQSKKSRTQISKSRNPSRERIVVANTKSKKQATSNLSQLSRPLQSGTRSGQTGTPEHWWASEPQVGRMANGVSNRVDRLKGLGNAVVPQVAEWIGKRIIAVENLMK